MILEKTSDFTIECLGEQSLDVYDIEVEGNHNFFGNNILVHNSNYLCFDEMMKNAGLKLSNNEFQVFADQLMDRYFQPYIDAELAKFFNSYNVDQHILEFKQEKTITQMYIFAKKKYATEVVANEGTVYDEPKIAITGVEIVRTSTPSFCIGRLKEALNLIFKSQNKKEMVSFLQTVKTEFEKAPVDTISYPRTVNDYTKYCGKINFKELIKNKQIPMAPKGCPIHVRGALFFNYLIERFDWKSQPVTDSGKIKFVYVKENNILKTNMIAYTDEWTPELAELFTIDYETQFYKSFIRVIERFFDVLTWGAVKLDQNELDEFMEF